MLPKLRSPNGTAVIEVFNSYDLAKKLLAYTIFSFIVLWCATGTAQPRITSLSPLVGYAGSTATITGTSFNATPANNIVYFGGMQATVTGGTTTTLTVTVPHGTTYQPVSVTNNATSLTSWSPQAFLQNFPGVDTGSVNFDGRTDFAAGVNPSGIAMGDIDGDGKPDIVVANSTSHTFSIYLNNSLLPGSITAATFSAPVSISVGISPYVVILGDIDGDGKLDIAAGAQMGNQILVVRNASTTGTVVFGTPMLLTSGGNLPYAVALGDIDGDGRPDLLATNDASNNFSAFRNTSTPGTISFAASVNFSTGSQPVHLAVQDIDGDGKPDVAIVNSASSNLQVFRNTSVAGAITSASFATPVSYTTPVAPQFVLIGDMDGDGQKDVIVGCKIAPSSINIFRSTSAIGAIALTNIFSARALNLEGMAIGDFNGDGKPDIVVTNLADTSVSVFRNNSLPGIPSFAHQVLYTTQMAPAFVVAGDIDGDGQAEIALTNYYSGTFSVLRNGLLGAPSGHQLCKGGVDTVQFTSGMTGGTWSSSDTSIAIADTFSGYVTGVAPGTATIYYILPGGTYDATVTVNAPPTAISGIATLCAGSVTTLAGTPAGGVWSATNTFLVSIGPSSGLVTAISPGLDTVSYYFGTPVCNLTATVNILPMPFGITGLQSVCVGATTALSDASTPGTWSSTDTTIGSVGISTGVVTGVAEGIVTIIYTTAGACTASTIFTVNPNPVPISGIPVVCSGYATSLTDASPGGTWSCTDVAVGSISSTGILTGITTTGGLANIIYTLTGGCIALTPITVNPSPAAITGTMTVLMSGTTLLSDATTGGAWSSGAPGIATVSASGLVTGVSGGTATISYVLPTSCEVAAVVTVVATTGTSNVSKAAGELILFPNPASSDLTITTDKDTYRTYAITNCMGQLMLHDAISHEQTTVDIKALPAGVYYIILKGDNGSLVQKFVKL